MATGHPPDTDTTRYRYAAKIMVGEVKSKMMQSDDGREIRDLRTSMVDPPVRGEQSPMLLCNSRLRAAECRAGMVAVYPSTRSGFVPQVQGNPSSGSRVGAPLVACSVFRKSER
jgi:hypothetical protein